MMASLCVPGVCIRGWQGARTWTKMRLAQMQVWPAFLNAEATTPAAAVSTSASSKTMKGAFPPSSSDTRFTVSAAPAISCFPTRVEPVNPIFLTVSDSSICLPAEGVYPPSAPLSDKSASRDWLPTTKGPVAGGLMTRKIFMAGSTAGRKVCSRHGENNSYIPAAAVHGAVREDSVESVKET